MDVTVAFSDELGRQYEGNVFIWNTNGWVMTLLTYITYRDGFGALSGWIGNVESLDKELNEKAQLKAWEYYELMGYNKKV